MAKTRDNYQIPVGTVDEVVRNLNFLLQRIGDRLDKLEGIRGESVIESSLEVTDSDSNIIHSLE